jgi:protein-tyrosine-phosphatase
MAEGLLRHRLQERGCSDIEVASTGTWADVGSPATPAAVETLATRGIDLKAHSSRAIDLDELAVADLIVGMTSVHQREIHELAPSVAPKFRLLKEISEIDVTPGPGSSASARLAAFLAAPRPEPRRSLDVDDPMGLPFSVYERTFGELSEGIDALLDLLCGPVHDEGAKTRLPGTPNLG